MGAQFDYAERPTTPECRTVGTEDGKIHELRCELDRKNADIRLLSAKLQDKELQVIAQLERLSRLQAELAANVSRIEAAQEKAAATRVNYENSTSWRLTAPLRRAAWTLQKVRRITRFVVRQFAGDCGFACLLGKFIDVYRKEGFGGLVLRFQIVTAQGANAAPARVLRSWDASREAQFFGALEALQRNNPGYFDRVFVSVVMPVRNREGEIGRAIKSLQLQSHDNWELIVVDDGSSDQTSSVVAGLQKVDPRIKLISGERFGVSKARNTGLGHARGEYVFFLDSDNQWRPTFLATMVAFMHGGKLDAAYSGFSAVDDRGELAFYRGSDFDWLQCWRQNYIDLNCFAHRRDVMPHCRFDESIRRLVDWDYILRVTAQAKTSYAPFLGPIYYDGSRCERITNSEYTVEQLADVGDYIRAKHPAETHSENQRAEIRPDWKRVMVAASRARNMPRDASEYSSACEREIAWGALEREAGARDPSLVSIIVLCYNGCDLTKNCLASLFSKSQSRRFEVIVVDNASTDSTPVLLADFQQGHPNLRVIRNDQNRMFSLGNNIGVAASRGATIVLLNNDTIVTDGWLDALVEPLDRDCDVGIVGPKLLYQDDTIQCCGIVFNSRASIPYHVYRGFARDHAAVNKMRSLQSLTGACMAMRATEFIALRGFDPTYINGCEDLDLCFRMRRHRGKRLVYTPFSEVYHLEGKTEGRGKHIMRNRDLFVERWGAQRVADDEEIYREDGFEVVEYRKPGKEKDGATAAYVPVLRPRGESGSVSTAAARRFNVAFSSIWHARGISFHTKQLADALEGERFRTFIFARWESAKFQNDGPIQHPRVFDAGDDPSPEDTVRWARDNEIDAFILMEVHPKDWKRVDALKAAGIKVICYENLDIMRTELLPRYSVFDTFLFNAFEAHRSLSPRYPHARSLLLPWGANIGAEPVVRSADDGKVHLVHIAGWGGLNVRKNSDLVLRCFDRAAASNLELHFYSQNSIDYFGEQYVDICRRNANIHVCEGTINNICDAYRGKDMLLMPSKREGLGLPIIEALSLGLPAIVTDGYMMKQWLMPGRHGVVCPGEPEYGRNVLPEVRVDEARLVDILRWLDREPHVVRDMQRNVAADARLWSWSWQSDVFKRELHAMLSEQSYRPAADFSYLPSWVLEFEKVRCETSCRNEISEESRRSEQMRAAVA